MTRAEHNRRYGVRRRGGELVPSYAPGQVVLKSGARLAPRRPPKENPTPGRHAAGSGPRESQDGPSRPDKSMVTFQATETEKPNFGSTFTHGCYLPVVG
jgi:hypothetical protein